MKSPQDIATRLAKQWHQSGLRVERLLSAESWPLEFTIGKPTGTAFATQTVAVHAHVQRWQAVNIGQVIWEPVKFRAGADPVNIPVRWRIHSPTEWASATADKTVQKEFATLEYLVAKVNERYRELLLRNRSLWHHKDRAQVVKTASLSDALTPGAAKGRPLRLLAGLGVDTKFFERNHQLLTRFLDERYHGAASEQGLHNFLDAYDENDHWVLVLPLSQGLLPFRRQRVTTRELTETPLPAAHIVVVENEQCEHSLPELPNTIAILGAGLDLQWLSSQTFNNKSIAYWGDMDTWGLLMLSRARQYRPNITPLLMTRSLFNDHAPKNAVPEPTPAQNKPPTPLTKTEADFYQHLLNQKNGRLEQEYLPEQKVKATLLSWLNSEPPTSE